MPRYHQMSLSMLGSSGITVVNMIKIAEKMLRVLEQHLKQLLYFLASAWDVCGGATWVFVLCVHISTPSCCCWGHLELLFQPLVLYNFFIHFPVFFWSILPKWCSLKVHFVFQHRSFSSAAAQCFYWWHFLNTTQLCILQLAQMWSYWSNIWGTASHRGKSGLLAPLGISVLMCSPFGILLPSHLLRACWQGEKPSICTALVCVHIKVLQRAEVVSLV